MVAWEVPLASPCEVSTIWITIIQWKIPCSMHKHTREVCKLIHLKVGNWEQIREVRRQKCWDKPQMQPYSWVLTVRLSRERGKIMLQLVLYSARGSKQIQWAFLQQWILGAAAEPGDLGRNTAQRYRHSCLVGGIPGRETKPQILAAP